MMTMELTAIKGAKQYLELSDLLGHDNDRVSLVLNRANVQSGIPIADVGASLKGELVGKLPDDPMLVLRAINEGVPFVQSAPTAALSVEVNRLAMWIGLPIHEEEPDATVTMAAPTGKISRWMRPSLPRRKTG
jgi:Flp pilus assembly CpaE family ATPase